MLASSLMRGVIQKSHGITNVKFPKRAYADSPLAQGDWYRIDVQEDGIYKLDLNYFRQANITVGKINSFRLFGNGGRQIPEDLRIPSPDSLVEISRLVVDPGKDGNFDQGDYILFYGRGTHGWTYDVNQKMYHHFVHPYAEKNCYFFTFDAGNGRSMDSVPSGTETSVFRQSDFQGKLFVEQEKYNLFGSGRRWVGKLFSAALGDITDTYVNTLSGLVSSAPIYYRFIFLNRSTTIDAFNVYENGQLLLGPIYMSTTDVSPLNNTGDYAYETTTLTVTRTGGVSGDQSRIKVDYESRSADANGWLDWLEILYRRRFEAVNDGLFFTSPDTSAQIEYTIHGLSSSDIFAFDVSDHSNVKRITQLIISADSCKFQLLQTAGSVRELAVVGHNGFKIPSTPIKIENSNIRGIQPPVDFIIISPKEFLTQANELKSYRESHDSLHTVVVNINQIYNEFSGGVSDVMAVRDFLRFAQKNWFYLNTPTDTIRPRYVLLFGWGHYDYKNISTTLPNWIPPYETAESVYQDGSYTSDDNFAFLNPGDNRISIAIGRLPVHSQQEAEVAVNKIISYETKSPLDPWRNRLTFVADDGFTSARGGSMGDDGSEHTDNSDEVANAHTPDSFEKNKIYIVEYPTVNTATGRRKPAAAKDIIDAFNQGTLIINYVGHGNEHVWAHEYIFTDDESVPQLTNRDRLSFLIDATCDFARYDDPQALSCGEQILTMEQGGVIAEVSASRAVWSLENHELNDKLCDCLFQRDTLGTPLRIGDAMWLMKQTQNGQNDKKYHLLGDPTLRLVIPRVGASVDSVNGISTVGTVQMKSLAPTMVVGAIRQSNGLISSAFNGRGIIQLFDAKRKVDISEGIGHFQFDENGSLLYRGEISITNGLYKSTVPIPKDVTFGSNSRISLYVWNNQNDGAGYTEHVVVNGTDTLAAIDTVGPHISLYLDDLNFKPGDVVKSNTALIVELEDNSGINTSTVGVGHRLTATMNNPERTFDLTNYYRSNLNTYQSGEIRYPLSNLADGKYSLRVKAWDIYNNSSEAETFFEVNATEDLALLYVMNYPNPFSHSTTFTFQRNSIDPIDVEIKIYTVAGRFIENIKAQNIVDRFVQIPWNGKDRDGDDLANGVYFYKLRVQNHSANITKETIGKLAIIR